MRLGVPHIRRAAFPCRLGSLLCHGPPCLAEYAAESGSWELRLCMGAAGAVPMPSDQQESVLAPSGPYPRQLLHCRLSEEDRRFRRMSDDRHVKEILRQLLQA